MHCQVQHTSVEGKRRRPSITAASECKPSSRASLSTSRNTVPAIKPNCVYHSATSCMACTCLSCCQHHRMRQHRRCQSQLHDVAACMMHRTHSKDHMHAGPNGPSWAEVLQQATLLHSAICFENAGALWLRGESPPEWCDRLAASTTAPIPWSQQAHGPLRHGTCSSRPQSGVGSCKPCPGWTSRCDSWVK